jgi:hypothetical protein
MSTVARSSLQRGSLELRQLLAFYRTATLEYRSGKKLSLSHRYSQGQKDPQFRLSQGVVQVAYAASGESAGT